MFVIAILLLLALVGGGLWRASRDRNRVRRESEENQTLEAPSDPPTLRRLLGFTPAGGTTSTRRRIDPAAG